MAKDPDNALMTRQQAQVAQQGQRGLAQTEAPVPVHRRAMFGMIQASVGVYGDVVQALLCDMGRIAEDIDELSWLATTQGLLEREHAYQVAVEQLAWWDEFLRPLPNPQLLSEHKAMEQRKAKAQRARALIEAKEWALSEHQRLVKEQLARPDLPSAERARLFEIHEEPDETEWWVDRQALIDQYMAQLPPLPEIVPIVLQDLDPQHSFSGFNAVQAMRDNEVLGPRALQMDQTLAAILSRELAVPKKEALVHAQRLTGIFWIALRRALTLGNHRLAVSVTLLAPSREDPVQEQFTRELLTSWFHYLKHIPEPAKKPSLLSRVPVLGRLLGGGEPKAVAAVQHKQLTGGEEG